MPEQDAAGAATLPERPPLDHFLRHELPEQVEVLTRLDLDEAARVLDALQSSHQAQLLESLPEERAQRLLELLPPDDRARLVSAARAGVGERLVRLLGRQDRVETEALLGYPDESSGRLMTPRFLPLSPEATVAEAIDQARSCAPEIDSVYSLPVTDPQGRLVGMADLRALLAARDRDRVGDVMVRDASRLAPEDDQEIAARTILEDQVLAAPVVDAGGVLLGLVTVDDAMEVLELELGEDFARGWGSQPLGQPYLATSLVGLARSRATWLLVLAFAATLTVNVLQLFESELEQIVTLALFVPLLIGTGGNAGAQATTTVVRALAVGEVAIADLPRTIWREVRIGLLLGAMLGALAFGPVAFLYEARMAVVVALTLVTVCAIATTVGSMLPVLADRAGLDPAVVSAPFITTLVDATGLLAYFLIARAVFGL